MKPIDEARLESDVQYRTAYILEFMGVSGADLDAIISAGPLLAPLVPSLVQAVYDKLYQYDATWRHFVPEQSGHDGPAPQSLADLSPDHPAIAFRKDKLARYLARLVTGPYDAKMITYLDFVGKIHTEKAGSPAIRIPLVQMNALMGFVSDALIATLLSMQLPAEQQARLLRAFNKLLWVQNDLIARHYQS